MQQVEVLERPAPVITPKRIRGLAIAAAILLLIVAVLAVVLARQWPFTQQAVTTALQQESGRTVQIAHYRETYFPHPGGVAEGVTFLSKDGPKSPPPITVQRLTIAGSYPGLLAHHLSSVRAEGLRLLVPPIEGRTTGSSFLPANSNLSVGEFVADGAVLTFAASQPGEQPLVFRIPKLTLSSIATNRALQYKGTVEIPLPPGEVEIAGRFGPWKSGSTAETPLSGAYTLKNADLSVFGGIAGKVSAKGTLDGVLRHIRTQGSADVPDFTVKEAGHPVHLVAQYQAMVNGLNGDVALQKVTTNFAKTTIVAQGKVEGQSEDSSQGKTVSLNFYSSRARLQDLLNLFASSEPPAMLGSILFRGQVEVPPGDRMFLKRVRLQGDFGISGGQYTDPDTQKNVDVASAKARGKADKIEDKNDKDGNDDYDPGKVLSNVKGHVVMQDAIANLSNLAFDVPGASAHAAGTYNLLNERVDMHGTVNLQAQLSKATTGVKSVLLKIVQPLIKDKKGQGSVVNLSVTGTYHNPSFSVTPAAK